MTVLLSDGRSNLKEVLHHILDTFFKDVDCTRGFFIKPNIVFPVKPGSHEITSPTLVRTIIDVLRERYNHNNIILGEGVAAGCDPQENFNASGYAKLAQDLEVPLIDLHHSERQTVVWKFGKLELPRLALESVYINLPILKASNACIISGALKNQKGLLLPDTKKQFHRHGLHEHIAELNSVVQPSLTIMDCSHFFGRYALVSGDNCGEIDSIACSLLGIEEPEHVKLSRKNHVFTQGFSVTGNQLKIKRPAIRPKIKQFKRIGRLRLWSNPLACTMCRRIFHQVEQDIIKDHNFALGARLISHSIKGAEIIMGKNPQWKREYQTVICIGECTRRTAKEGGYSLIPGCPPTLEDFKNHLP